MAPADDRITIRDKTTGELKHGIKGHVPEGWEEIGPDGKAVTESKP